MFRVQANIVFTVILLSLRAQGGELYETYISARAAGMGNAYTAIVKDDDALFYNPAGIARIEGINWTVFNLGLGANALQVSENVTGLQSTDSSAFADSISGLAGERFWLIGKGKSAISVPGFAAGVFASLNLGANVENPSFPNLNLNYTQDYGFVTGFALDFIPEIMSVGMTAKRIARTGARVPVGMETLATLSSSDLASEINNKGIGYGIDMGINLTIPVPLAPTFSFVWKDMGTTRFSMDSGVSRPPAIQNEFIFGVGLDIDALLVNVRPTIDYKHAFDYDEVIGKKVHIGIEFDFPAFEARAGIHQGYYTLGAGLDLSILRVDVATYGVELGEYPGQLEDRRYLLELSMQFGVDPDFGLFNSNGKGRTMGSKQRR